MWSLMSVKFYGNWLRGFGVTGPPPKRHFLYSTFIALTAVSALPSALWQGSPTLAREDVHFMSIQFLLQYWHLKSSKFNDFHFIWKGEIWLVFCWKKRPFFYPCPFNPKFENVSLALHPRNFVHREPQHRAKIFSYDPTQCLATIHLLQADRQMTMVP